MFKLIVAASSEEHRMCDILNEANFSHPNVSGLNTFH